MSDQEADVTMLDEMKVRHPDVDFHVRRAGGFELVACARRSVSVIGYGDGTGGLYVGGGFMGRVRTPLAARGPVEALEALEAELLAA